MFTIANPSDATSLMALFFILTAIMATPGPNNTFLLLSGAQKGYVKSLPALISINLGVCAVLGACVTLLDGVGGQLSTIQTVARIGGSVLLVYTAYTMWPKSGVAGAAAARNKEQKRSVLYLFFFQFLNPKIWMAVIAVAASFAGTISLPLILLTAYAVGFVFNSLWVVAGGVVRARLGAKYERQVDQAGSLLILACVLFLYL